MSLLQAHPLPPISRATPKYQVSYNRNLESSRHRLRMTVDGLQRETKYAECYTACPQRVHPEPPPPAGSSCRAASCRWDALSLLLPLPSLALLPGTHAREVAPCRPLLLPCPGSQNAPASCDVKSRAARQDDDISCRIRSRSTRAARMQRACFHAGALCDQETRSGYVYN